MRTIDIILSFANKDLSPAGFHLCSTRYIIRGRWVALAAATLFIGFLSQQRFTAIQTCS